MICAVDNCRRVTRSWTVLCDGHWLLLTTVERRRLRTARELHGYDSQQWRDALLSVLDVFEVRDLPPAA